MRTKSAPGRLKGLVMFLLGAVGGGSLQAQSSLQEALKDQQTADFWHYDDLESAMAAAEESGKPILATIRCVPCKACLGMDSQVVNPTDPELRRLMAEFVCVRIVQAWGLDLSLFQYDMNMSWAAFLLNSDRVVYGRYGTRAAQRDDRAITVPGFKQALAAALEWHARYREEPEKVAALFAAKKGPAPRWKRPEDMPAIPKTVRFDKTLGRMTARQTAACVHCHFVPAAEMMGLLSAGDPITDRHLWAYPLPETIGLTLDPERKASITEVAGGSAAERAGLKPGETIESVGAQPILSIADVQWVLHRADESDDLEMLVSDESGSTHSVDLSLAEGWRRKGDFAERISSWDFFKVKIFGVSAMSPLSGADSEALDLASGKTALRVEKLAPSWGDMNLDARKAGLREGDVVVGVDGRTDIGSHSDLLAYLVQEKESGEKLALEVVRDGRRQSLEIPLNWDDRLGALRKP